MMRHDVLKVTHEPECALAGYEFTGCTMCMKLRQAYRHGLRAAQERMRRDANDGKHGEQG